MALPSVLKSGRQKTDVPYDLRTLGHVEGLDGLRGFTVIIVVISHFNVILPAPRILVIPGGVVSLDSFFVLSGFLITYLLLREQSKRGQLSSKAFYRRRAFRILPALVVMVALHWIYANFAGLDMQLENRSASGVLFYYANWMMAFGPKDFMGGAIVVDGYKHLWSLSFEEQFYLLWPVVTIFLLTIRTRLRTVVIVLTAMIVLVALHRAQAYQSSLTGDSYRDSLAWYPIMIRTDTRVDSILIGALMAHVWIRGKVPTKYLSPAAWVAAIFLLICFPLVELQKPFLYLGGISLIDIAICVLLLAIVEGVWGGNRFFKWKPMIAIGIVSYGLYLWHLPVLFAVDHHFHDWNPWLRLTVAVVLITAVTLASWFLVEKPMLRYKDRFERRDATRISGSAEIPGDEGDLSEARATMDADAAAAAEKEATALAVAAQAVPPAGASRSAAESVSAAIETSPNPTAEPSTNATRPPD